jgi:hypothetical protein
MIPIRHFLLVATLCLQWGTSLVPPSPPPPPPPPAPIRLQSWFGDLLPIIGNLTLLDISLPGTHDTLTYDLSTTVADNANDLPSWASWLLHTFRSFDTFVGKVIRQNAMTQELNVTAQLNAGIRFLDLRTIYTAPPTQALGKHDWYSLHMVESNQKSMVYFNAVADFLHTHPTEIVVIMLTRHGCQQCTGDQQYPGSTTANEQAFWAQIKEAFATAGVGFVPSAGVNYSSVNSTTIATLVANNQRVLLYAGDYGNFTKSDPLAWDGNYVLNGAAGENVANLTQSFVAWDEFYRNNAQQREDLKRQNKFFLMSLAGSPPGDVTQYAAEIYMAKLIGLHPKDLVQKCAANIHIPNLTDWCPSSLNEWERLRNFYSQVFMDRIAQETYQTVYSPPGAIYIDVVGEHGEIRTDSQASDRKGFAYVDTLLLWNVRRACGGGGGGGGGGGVSALCLNVEKSLVARRSAFPCHRWDDVSTGRHSNWPPLVVKV